MAANDNQNIVGPGEAALIVASDGDLRVIVPDPDNYPEIHPNAVLLGVVAVRARDSKWVEESLPFTKEITLTMGERASHVRTWG